MLSRQARAGFTLVEVLIVVVLLGILASMIIPQFQDTIASTRKAALSDQLQSLRVQIQLYTVQHERPPLINGSDWDDLITQTTNSRGIACGPYLPTIPKNVLNQHSDVAVVSADPQFGDPITGQRIGFVYNRNNGFIWGTNTAGDRVFNEQDLNDPNN